MSQHDIRLALVVDTVDSYDDNGVQVVDLLSLQPLGHNTYIIRTKEFNDHALVNGAGLPITPNEIHTLLHALKH